MRSAPDDGGGTRMGVIRKACRLLTPPIFEKIWAKLSAALKTPPFEYFSGAWDSFSTPGRKCGWDTDGVLVAAETRWKAFCDNASGTGPLGFSHEHHDLTIVDSPYSHNVHITFAYVLALAVWKKDRISVLDYGGAIGHYHRIARAVAPQVELEYHIKEVPGLVSLGRQLSPDIQWHTDDGCLDRTYDLVVVNGSLQYIQHWEQCLEGLCRTVGKYFLLTRIPIVDHNPSFLAIQRVYGSEMLYWQFNREAVLGIVRKAGLQIMREVVVGDRLLIPGAPEEFVLRGWIFRR